MQWPYGDIKTDDVSMVEILNCFFSSVFTEEDLSDLPQPKSKTGEAPLTSVHITAEKVTEKIAKLQPSSAPGPDKVYPRVLHTLKVEIALPLSIIFNKSLVEGVVPTDWKVANVTPIFKKGSKTDPGNYRPVSLTSVVCRVMESLLRDSIVSHLTLNDLTVTGAGEVLTEQPLISTRIAFYKPSSPPRSANDSPYIHRFLWNLTGKCFLLTHPKQQWESWHGHFGFTKVLQSVL